MINVPGYDIKEEIYIGADSIVYKAVENENNKPVVIKLLKSEYPGPDELKDFQSEYNIARSLDSVEGIVQNYTMIDFQNTKAIILEDFGGISLDRIIKEKKLEIKNFLYVAIKCAGILEEIHNNKIIHKDIKPHNILINSKSGQIKIIDFGIASRLTKEVQSVVNPDGLEGTIYYISPEQTGRMNRSIDYRTDLYSLGVSFYQMITGRVPFQSDDPMEIVHSHMARVPESPSVIDTEIPVSISNIILKLMEKTAEKRYMSAFGLKKDLSKCYAIFTKSGKIDEFPIGKDDISDRFQIPEKIYGRDNEISHLMDVFKKVSGGVKELVFFSGQSGIGKTVIINEVHKPIVEKRGYFIDGKYDQFKRNIPYTSIIQAFTDLAKEIITESDDKLIKWKFEISKALGDIGGVITEMIPALEMIIGKQPEVQELPAAEAQNRFNMVFQSFIQVFATEKHPLVLFLDDLQWADSASLNLMEILLCDDELKHFLFLGTYRDNEVDKSHPFVMMQDKLKKNGLDWEDIKLSSISKNDIKNLLVDTLKSQSDELIDLAELVYSKTDGNPFFVTEFLKTLHSENLIYFKEGWKWELDKIDEKGITGNIIELMADKIQKLPPQTLQVMKAACCIGVKFYLDTLAKVCGEHEDETYEKLEYAINLGMILIKDKDTRFVHDKVREATYSLISENEQKKYHYKIGKILLERINSDNSQDIIFAVVNQLNLAIDLLDKSEKNQLIDLNCKAAKKAKASAAYDSALDFFNTSKDLLGDRSWKTDYSLTFFIYKNLSELETLNNNFSESDKLNIYIIEKAESYLDKVEIYTLMIIQYTRLDNQIEALKLLKKVLRRLGIRLPRKPTTLSVLSEMVKIYFLRKGKTIESLLDLPEMKKKKTIFAAKLLYNALALSYNFAPDLFPVIALKLVSLTMKNGIHQESSPFAFTAYGLIVGEALKDRKKAIQYGDLSIKLAERYENAKALKSKIFMGYGYFLYPWLYPLKDAINYQIKGIQCGIETGDFEYSEYNLRALAYSYAYDGTNLDQAYKNINKYLPLTSKLSRENLDVYFLYREVVRNLHGISHNKIHFKSELFDETSYERAKIKKDTNFEASYFISKTFLSLFLCNYEVIPEVEKNERKILKGSFGVVIQGFYLFYLLMCLSQIYNSSSNKEKKRIIRKIKKELKKLKSYEIDCPANWSNKVYIVEAELFRITDNFDDACLRYSESIKAAKKYNVIHEEAIANEYAAKFYLSMDLVTLAATYMKEARYCYLKWGAMAKVEQLDDKYSDLLATVGSSQVTGISEDSDLAATRRSKSVSSISGGSGHSGSLDLTTVMKASNAISGEIEMKKLLSSMINILIENAGAQIGLLILFVDDHLFIEAEANIDSKEITVLQSIPLEKGVDLSPAIVRYVAKTKESIVLDNASEDTSYSSDSYIQKRKPLSILCTPIINQGRLAAVLYLENNLASGVFTPERVEILKVLSSQAAISIENARLIENLSEQERLKKEMEIAERIQTSLCPPSPEHAEFEIAAAMNPAEEVGGDYYDIVEDATGALWFAIGDVSGHGVTPGLIMMMAETAFGSNVEDSEGIMPSEVIKRMNRILCKNIKDRLKESHFMTMNLLKHLGDGRFVHAGAHLDIIVYRAETKRCELFETGGLFLGMIPDISHAAENSEFKMEMGDILIVYTDGVTEAADSDGKLLDPDGLCAIIEKNIEKGVNGLCSAIVSETLDWCNQKQADDITLIVAKRK